MTDKDLLAKARKEAGSIWRLQRGLEVLLGGHGPSYVNLSRIFRGNGPLTPGVKAAMMLFLQQPQIFRKAVREADRRRSQAHVRSVKSKEKPNDPYS